MRWNLKVLKAECEQEIGYSLTYRQIEEDTSISKSTITSLMNNQTRRVDFDIVEGLLKYFSAKTGRQLGLTDILKYEPEH